MDKIKLIPYLKLYTKKSAPCELSALMSLMSKANFSTICIYFK